MNPIHHKRKFEVPLPTPSIEKKHKIDFSHIKEVEDKGWFDHSVSVTTNELKLEKTFLKLRKIAVERDTVIGVSGLFALDIAVQRGDLSLHNVKKIENVVIIDCSLRVWHFWRELGKIVRRCKLRKTVIARIKTLVREQALFYYNNHRNDSFKDADQQAKLLQERIDQGLSWLSNEEYFQKGKKLFDERRIYTLLSDISEPATLKGVVKELKNGGHTVDTIYISDIFSGHYLKKGSLEFFKENIPPKTFVIQALAFPLYCCGKHVAQKVFTVM